MKITLALILVVCAYTINGIIMPMTKSDGTLDVSSLLSHIALLEQSLENKASQADITRLEANDKTIKTDVQAQLAKANDELKAAQVKIALLETKLSTQCSCNSSANNIPQSSTEMTTLQTDVGQLKQDVLQLKSVHTTNGGSTYTRWGRTSCPADTNVVYIGFTGGTLHQDKGGASSIVCLPEHPVYANHTDNHYSWTGHISGTEYDSSGSNLPFYHLHDEDMPCVVCESPRSKSIMVPGRKICHQGWNLEYWGYLMSAYPDYASSDYVCVDADAEAVPGGHANTNGQALFLVESICGSLPCPPYHDNWEVSCAVCSK